jgi:hypothetical protein
VTAVVMATKSAPTAHHAPVGHPLAGVMASVGAPAGAGAGAGSGAGGGTEWIPAVVRGAPAARTTRITGPAFVAVIPAAPGPFAEPTTTTPTIPAWNVHT